MLSQHWLGLLPGIKPTKQQLWPSINLNLCCTVTLWHLSKAEIRSKKEKSSPIVITTFNSLEKYDKDWELPLWGKNRDPLPEMMARLHMAKEGARPLFYRSSSEHPKFSISLWCNCSDYHNPRAPYVTFPTLHKFTGNSQFICFLTNVSAWISEMQTYRSWATTFISIFHSHQILHFFDIYHVSFGLVTELSLDA